MQIACSLRESRQRLNRVLHKRKGLPKRNKLNKKLLKQLMRKKSSLSKAKKREERRSENALLFIARCVCEEVIIKN